MDLAHGTTTARGVGLTFRILHDAGAGGLTIEEWNKQAREQGIGTARKATLTDLRNALLDRQMVRQSGDQWFVDHR